jgi:glycogen debranching enzyme
MDQTRVDQAPGDSAPTLGSTYCGHEETQFVVPPASSVRERLPRTLKHGDSFGVFDSSGDAMPEGGSAEGFYYRDTRHVSRLLLLVDDVRPVLLSSTISNDNGTLTCDLTNPDLMNEAGEKIVDHDLIHVRRSRFVWQAACYERLAVSNFDQVARRLRVSLLFEADFADLFEVRGTHRARRGVRSPASVQTACVTLSYTGLDHVQRVTRFRFDPAPDRLDSGRADFVLDLPAGGMRVLFLEIACAPAPVIRPARRDFLTALAESRRALRRSAARGASVASNNELFNEAVRRSVADLALLMSDTPQGGYPYAGIPWFSTVFGRDGLITALQTLWADPAISLGVLRYLAANQSDRYDPAADAEPGKILHEVRHGEMAELGEVPFRRYYGSVDATPLFVMLAGAYLDRTGDLASVAALWPNIERALGWIETDGDKDGDGFVEYGRQTEIGLANQGWKDSHDSIFHEDGRLAQGPIALVEVQAYVFGAWRAAASIAGRLGHAARAAKLEEKAARLREQFDARFFDAALGTYVLALDGAKNPCRVRTSNAGHALLTGIAYAERAPAVVATLMAGPSFSGWGVRTVASTESRYNPMSYHNGSVWPHDNALIAAGFARYGFHADAARIFEGLFAASGFIELRRLPELFCGFARQRSRGPTFYPVACSPQAWAAVAPLSLTQSSLGLGFDPAQGEIVLQRPALPPFLDEVVLRNVALGGGTADIAVRREGGDIVVDVLRQAGTVVVTRSCS